MLCDVCGEPIRNVGMALAEFVSAERERGPVLLKHKRTCAPAMAPEFGDVDEA